MYGIRWEPAHVAGPIFWTEAAAWRAWGQSELAVVEPTEVDARGLDVGLRARQARQDKPFDPQGHWRRLVVNQLTALEYEFRTGSRGLWDFYFRGGPRPADAV